MACLLADRAGAAGAELLRELAFFRCATRPGARQAPGDASGLHNVQHARTPASRMECETRREVARAAQGVARVLGAGVEMQQGDHRFPLWSPVAVRGLLHDVWADSPLQ